MRAEQRRSWLYCMVVAAIVMLTMLFVRETSKGKANDLRSSDEGIKTWLLSKVINSGSTTSTATTAASARKLLQSADEGDSNRIGTACSKDDILIYQGTTNPLPSGIPGFTVQIMNVGVSGCSISDIHVSCGWFSSSHLINPRVFKRMYYDDCLVNDGEALAPGETLSFQYANSFPYPLSVSSVSCNC